jgi:penicillin-binding protein 2
MSVDDSERARLFTRRALMIGGAQAALFSVLAGRIYYLQIVEGHRYRTLAEENRVNLRLIPPRRGVIIDRIGVPMAVNQQNYHLVLLPEQVDNLPKLIDKIGTIIDLSDSDRKRIARDMNEESNLNAVMVKDNLTWEQVAALSVHSLDLPGTDIETGEVRAYPYGAATSHLLGYVGTVSEKDVDAESGDDNNGILSIPGFRVGKSGIEKQYDLELRGDAGNVQMEVNAHGRVVRELTRKEPTQGHDIEMTIDIGLQQFTQQRLSKEASAAAVVLDVHTGAVLALASQPGFDPNLFTFGISQDDWDSLNNDEHTPLLNKAISGLYSPGSTVKPMMAMTGLESGILDPDAAIFCPGYYDLGNHRFHCWKKGGHGYISMKNAIIGSCDTYFYDLGKRLGVDRMQTMAERFGLNRKTGIDMPHERSGIYPSRTWKLATQGSLWQQGETLVAAIGQGYVLVTPLQLAVMVARIANGGKAITPHLTRKIGDTPTQISPAPSMELDPRHVARVHEAMTGVVNSPGGTGYRSRLTIPGVEMAGKTGTSQVRKIGEGERGLSEEALPWKDRDNALFICFAPADAPRYAIAVVVEHGGEGAHAAAPIAKDIMQQCLTQNLAGALAPNTPTAKTP